MSSAKTILFVTRRFTLTLSFLFSFFLTTAAHAHTSLPHHSNKIDSTVMDFKHAEEVSLFIDYMIQRHGFSKKELVLLFSKVHFSQKTIQLIKPSPLPKFKNWEVYKSRFVEPVRIQAGVAFWDKYESALERAEQVYGVPAHIIVGILGVETIYGKNVGNFRVIDVLSTLGFAYPDTPNKTARMTYFRNELEQSLLFARESGIDPLSLIGSYAGAIGWPQFMPSSIRQYGVDFDNKGKIDLRRSPLDAIGSVANFLVQHGWKTGLPLVFPATPLGDQTESMLASNLSASYTLEQLKAVVEPIQKEMSEDHLYGLIDLQNGENPTDYWLATQNFFAITKYNRSYFYAMSVIELGKAICLARQSDKPCQ